MKTKAPSKALINTVLAVMAATKAEGTAAPEVKLPVINGAKVQIYERKNGGNLSLQVTSNTVVKNTKAGSAPMSTFVGYLLEKDGTWKPKAEIEMALDNLENEAELMLQIAADLKTQLLA